MARLAPFIFGLLIFLGAPQAALAQSTCPSIATGAVLTAAQWNACFSAKQNTLGYTPVNRAGDTMLGKLTTAASQTSSASFNIPQGSAPASPQNGDIWTTLTGVYARINGATVGPFGAISGSSFAATAPLGVTFPAGVVTYALNYDSSLTLSGSNLSVATAPAGALTGTTLAANVVSSSLTAVGALSSGSLASGFTPITNALLANSSTTVNGQICSLGGSCTVSAVATSIAVGATAITGGSSGRLLYDNAGVIGELTVTGSGSAVLATSPSIASPTFTGTVAGSNTIPLSILAQSGANTMLGNWTGSAANVTANAMPSCPDTGGNHLNYVSGTGIVCGTSTGAAAAGTLTGTTLAANIVSSSLTSVGTLTGGATGAGFTIALGASTITGTLTGTNIASNTVANSNLTQAGAATLKGNPTASTANVVDFTVQSLTQSLTPDVTNDMLVIWDSVAGTLKKINPTTIASSSVAGVASIDAKTGAFATSTGITTVVNDIRLASIAADNLLMNATGSSAAPAAVAVGNCATALTYDTSGHAFGCRSTTGTGNIVQATSPTLVSPALGTPTSLTLTNASGLPISGINGLGTGVGTALAVNVGTSGSFIVNGGALGTPASGTLSNASGLPISTGVSGLGTGIASALAINTGSAGAPGILIAKGTSALGTGAISSGACATVVTTSASGVATTDTINASFNSDPTGVTGYAPTTNGMLTVIAYPTAGNVNFKVCNNTFSSITPGAITLNWIVLR